MMQISHVNAADTHVALAPLCAANAAALAEVADANPTIFTHWPRAVSHGYAGEAAWTLAEQAAGRTFAHVVMSPMGEVLGHTSYLAIRPEHAGVEIGMTWYAPAAQGAMVNPAAKRLLLANAFAAGAERVELKTDSRNARSRAAILKLGATFEGIFRRHMRRPDGSWRDTAWYSILRTDWPAVRAGLERRLEAGGEAS